MNYHGAKHIFYSYLYKIIRNIEYPAIHPTVLSRIIENYTNYRMPLEYVSKKISFYCQYHLIDDNTKFYESLMKSSQPDHAQKLVRLRLNYILGLKIFNQFVKICYGNVYKNSHKKLIELLVSQGEDYFIPPDMILTMQSIDELEQFLQNLSDFFTAHAVFYFVPKICYRASQWQIRLQKTSPRPPAAATKILQQNLPSE